MAGSRKWQVYIDDNSTRHAVQLDESNGELTGFEDFDDQAAIDGVQPLPSSIKMRHCVVREPISGSTRTLYIGNPLHGIVLGSVVAVLLFAFSGSTAGSAISWAVVRYVAEQRETRKPFAGDTGFKDGDDS